MWYQCNTVVKDFYPRSPCGERPAQKRHHGSAPADFYPRSPCGERLIKWQQGEVSYGISIHALLAESDYGALKHVHVEEISIHALLAESDAPRARLTRVSSPFLSTLSLRRATAFRSPRIALMVDFYPRSPCGERHISFYAKQRHLPFLSTLSLRRAT